jgi:hypothetical protein
MDGARWSEAKRLSENFARSRNALDGPGTFVGQAKIVDDGSSSGFRRPTLVGAENPIQQS